MNKWLRLLKHRWLDESDARRRLGPQTLAHVESRVKESERHHRGEIRVCIEAGLPLSYLWRDASARERAVSLFGKLRVWDTEDNSGVLIYLLLADRRIEIVADRGLNRHVSPAQWKMLLDGMAESFRRADFDAGLNHAIDVVDALLREHFPRRPGREDQNELPDAPVVI